MSHNAKRAVVFTILAIGLIFLIIGWVTSTFAFWTGVIVFHCFLFVSIVLRVLWGVKRDFLFVGIALAILRRLKRYKS